MIRGSSIESLDCFIYLFEVKATKNLYAYAYGRYAVAIYGLRAL